MRKSIRYIIEEGASKVFGLTFFFFVIIALATTGTSRDVTKHQNRQHGALSPSSGRKIVSPESLQEPSTTATRFVGYGELADGTEVSLYVSVEPKEPTRPLESSQQFRYCLPRTAENGSYYGEISENTGRPKTVYVRGYYRRDGTYVRSHYRSAPR